MCPPDAGSLYGMVAPHKKREREGGLNKHQAVFTTENSAADEPCQRWLCREKQRRKETKERERER